MHPIVISGFSVLFLLFFARNITNYYHDIFLAFPIVKESANPGLYSPFDLLVQSGMAGPFHIYKMFGIFYSHSLPVSVDILWFMLNCFIQFLIFVGIWCISYVVTKRKDFSSISTFFIALSHPFMGTLHWSLLPPHALVSSVFALPIQYASFILFLRKKFILAVLVSGFSSYLHPIGYMLTGSFLLYICLQYTFTFRDKLIFLLIGIFGISPALLYTYFSLPANFQKTNVLVYEQFKIFAYHAFIEDHFREWYAWFFLQLGGTIYFLPYIPKETARILKYFIYLCLAIMVAYAANLYMIKNQSVMLLFLFRMTLFLKPILFCVPLIGVSYWIYDQYNKKKTFFIFGCLTTACYIGSILIQNIFISEELLIVLYGFILLHDKLYGYLRKIIISLVGISLLCALGYSIVTQFVPTRLNLCSDSYTVFRIVIGIAFFVTISLSSLKKRTHIQLFVPYISFLRVLLFFLICIGIIQSMRAVRFLDISYAFPEKNLYLYTNFSVPVTERDRQTADWIRKNTRMGSLFLLPPDSKDFNDFFTQFRVATDRGVYILVNDINQLAYDVNAYAEAANRLNRIKVKIMGRHIFDTSGYYALTNSELAALGKDEHVDFALFEKKLLHNTALLPFVVYENNLYVIIDMSKMQ